MKPSKSDLDLEEDIRKETLQILQQYDANIRPIRLLLHESRIALRHSLGVYTAVESLILGVTKFLNTIEFILSRVLRNMRYGEIRTHERNILRLAIYENLWCNVPISTIELNYLNKHPHLLPIVNEAARSDLEKLCEGMKLVNRYSIMLSHPTFIVETLFDKLAQEDAIELMKANNGPRTYYLRINKLKADETEALRTLKEQGVQFETVENVPGLFSVTDGIHILVVSKPFRNRQVVIQDKSSVLAIHSLAPEPGDTVWDSCAAPGMKTQLIWEIMQGEGRLVASDIHIKRIRNAKNLSMFKGMEDIQWVHADASKPILKRANKILIDAPCSSTGMLRSHPSFKWRLNKKTLFSLMTIQNKILDGIISAYTNQPETEMVYATCSLLPHEGESQIDSMITRHNIELLDMPIIGSPGYSGFKCSEKVRRFFPHRHKCNGFFLARFSPAD